jgi:hypothetical protein
MMGIESPPDARVSYVGVGFLGTINLAPSKQTIRPQLFSCQPPTGLDFRTGQIETGNREIGRDRVDFLDIRQHTLTFRYVSPHKELITNTLGLNNPSKVTPATFFPSLMRLKTP